LLALNELLGDQLEGRDLLIWTETGYEDISRRFILRCLNYGSRYYSHAENSCNDDAVRLIGNK